MKTKTKSDSISAKQLLAYIEKYKKQLHESDNVKSIKFSHILTP